MIITSIPWGIPEKRKIYIWKYYTSKKKIEKKWFYYKKNPTHVLCLFQAAASVSFGYLLKEHACLINCCSMEEWSSIWYVAKSINIRGSVWVIPSSVTGRSQGRLGLPTHIYEMLQFMVPVHCIRFACIWQSWWNLTLTRELGSS